MERNRHPPPAVMVFAGLDSTGGAGLAADVEAIRSLGAHPLPVITTITAQDTRDVRALRPVDPVQVVEQARPVLDDVPVAAFKIGLLGSVEIAETVHSLLTDYAAKPVVLDPIFKAGGGGVLADEDLLETIVSRLCPRTTILTPNTVEAQVLAPQTDSLDAAAHKLLSYGSEYVLITGTHTGTSTSTVLNRLYCGVHPPQTYEWERLPGEYHGSGCTLSSAIAALLAQEIDPLIAIGKAQEYTWSALRHGYRPGFGQLVPDRFRASRQGT